MSAPSRATRSIDQSRAIWSGSPAQTDLSASAVCRAVYGSPVLAGTLSIRMCPASAPVVLTRWSALIASHCTRSGSHPREQAHRCTKARPVIGPGLLVAGGRFAMRRVLALCSCGRRWPAITVVPDPIRRSARVPLIGYRSKTDAGPSSQEQRPASAKGKPSP